MKEIRNARIDGTALGSEDHGIMTCFIYLDYGDGGHQGFGGYALDTYNKLSHQREGVAFGMSFIMNVLDTVGVTKWEDLKGKYVRVESDMGKVYRIGHITENKWFDPKELADSMK